MIQIHGKKSDDYRTENIFLMRSDLEKKPQEWKSNSTMHTSHSCVGDNAKYGHYERAISGSQAIANKSFFLHPHNEARKKVEIEHSTRGLRAWAHASYTIWEEENNWYGAD